MSDVVPAWERALDALERGDRAAANAHLDAEAVDRRPSDRRVMVLLRGMLESTTAPPPAEREDDDEPRTPPVTEREAVASSLALAERARVALAEGRVDDLVVLAERTHRATPERWAWLRLRSASLDQAVFRFTGQVDARDRAIRTASAIADRLDAPHMAVLARGILGTIHLLSGHLHKCLDACDAAIELAAVTDLAAHPHVALAHQFRGYVLYEWNRLDEAREALSSAWELSTPSGRGVRSGAARLLMAVYAATGDDRSADRWLAHLEEIVAEPMTLRNREWLAAVRVRHGTQRTSDLRAIDGWRQRWDYRERHVEALTRDQVRARLHELEHLLTVLEATSQWTDLLEMAATVRAASDPLRLWFAVRAEAARAVALARLGRVDEADEAWRRALEEGAPEGFVRAYLDGAPLRLELLRRNAEEGGDGRAVRHAAAVLAAAGGGGIDGARALLSPRQRDVLTEVARGATDQAVARTLGISTSTAKTHLREIYRRLGVGSRTQAVAEGRRLGLLPLL